MRGDDSCRLGIAEDPDKGMCRRGRVIYPAAMSSVPPTTAAAPARSTSQDTLRAVLFMLLAINLLPFMNVAAKFLSGDYHTVQVVWARYTGHLVFVILMFMPRHGLSLFRASKPGIHFIRSLLMFLATACFFTALRFIEVPVASAINFTSPLIVTALAAPFLGEVVGIRRWTAVAVGFAGALIIIRPGGGETHWAMFLVLGTALCYATYQIYTRKFSAADSPETSITYIAVVGAVISSIALPFYWVTPVSVIDAGLFALLGFIGGLGHYFVIRAFQYGEASVLAPFNYGQLVMAIILSYFVFGTFPDIWTFVGGGIIVSSGLYITYRETLRGKKPTAPPSPNQA
jgi:drug/metabolite transporter (DMT)-like permease